MPIYDYRCKKCGEIFEQLVLKNTVPACSQCASEDVEQQVSAFSVSSLDMTKARVAKARSAYQNSSECKEKKVAEAEAIKHHYEDHH